MDGRLVQDSWNHDALFLPNVEHTPSGMASQVNARSKYDLSSVYERSRSPYNDDDDNDDDDDDDDG
jgi:hypothetical protein